MGRDIILWLAGVPLTIIVLLHFFRTSSLTTASELFGSLRRIPEALKQENVMHEIIYLVGLFVVVIVVLGALGLH